MSMDQRLLLLAEQSIATNDVEMVYDLDAVRRVSDHLIDLPDGGALAVAINGIHASFVVFSRAYQPTDTKGNVIATKLSPVFRGEGPSEGLRELRHSYWGGDGYLFYPPAGIIIAAFRALEEWFDVK